MKYITLIFIVLAGCDNTNSALPEQCLLIPDPGICMASFKRYYFDIEKQQCSPFIYGGCEGSVPFKTEEECVQTCIVKK